MDQTDSNLRFDLHEVCPLGKLLYPSFITALSPLQMTSPVTASNA